MQTEKNTGGPEAAVKLLPPGLKDGADITLVEITLQKITEHERRGPPVGINDKYGAVIIRSRHLQFANGGAIQQPEAELPQAGLRRQGSAINDGEKLRKDSFELHQLQFDAFNIAFTEHSRGIGHALN